MDDERVAVLEAALKHEPPDDPCRARLLALLAVELLWSPGHLRRRSLSDEAVALARERGDRAALAHVLTMSAARLGQPRLAFVLETQRAWRAQLAGRLDEAEQLAEQARTLGDEVGEPDALSLYVGQLGPIRWHQGRLGEEAELLSGIAEAVPAVSAFTAMAALAELESGGKQHAAELLRDRAPDASASPSRDPVQLGSLLIWAEAAARVAESKRDFGVAPPYRAAAGADRPRLTWNPRQREPLRRAACRNARPLEPRRTITSLMHWSSTSAWAPLRLPCAPNSSGGWRWQGVASARPPRARATCSPPLRRSPATCASRG